MPRTLRKSQLIAGVLLTVSFVASAYLLAVPARGQASGAVVEDIFGRVVNQNGIVLVDWEGYMANPALKLFVKPPSSIAFPATAVISSSAPRLYFDLPSTFGAAGSSKTVTLSNASSSVPFLLSIFPDRDTADEDYALTIRLTGANGAQTTQTISVHVVDQDKTDPQPFQITLDFTKDQTGFFGDAAKRDIVHQAANDWAYFFDGMNLDTVPAGTETTFIWSPTGFHSGHYTTNINSYKGFLLYAYGIHTDQLRSGGEPSFNGGFQTAAGGSITLPLKRSGGVEMETQGNYNTLGWFLTTGDNDWHVTGNLGHEQNDLYSIVHHEIGHALIFNPAHTRFRDFKNMGSVQDAAVLAYHGPPPPIDQFDHLNGSVDRQGRRGAYGYEYFGDVPGRRWLITKLDLLVAQAIGYQLRTTSALVPLSVQTSSLPAGTVGASYGVALQAQGGIPFYNWTVDSGELPSGLSLNSFTGAISGTPTQAGTFNFNVRVRDYDEGTAGVTRALSITINPNSTHCSSTPIAYGETKQGLLTRDDCLNPFRNARADEYTFNGTAGQQISISMSSTAFDTYLYLFGPNGSWLAEDGGGDGFNSLIPPGGFLTLPSTGTYSILASSYAPESHGAYTLTLSKRADTISGQVIGSGVGQSGITVSLSGGASATTTTDASGNYSFVDLPAGASYTITPTDTAQYSFTPQTVLALQGRYTVNFHGTPHVIISEFRFRGTNGATDEFIELYNQTDQTRDITGWTLASGGTPLHIVNSGSIPPRSHYLITGASYSLPAASDGALSADIPDSAAVALFSTSTAFVSGTRIDAVGFSTADELYIEGGSLSPASGITTDSEHAFVRKLTSGTPRDTDNNSADFVLVATNPLVVGNNAVLGAPGAENRISPTQRNSVIKASLIDPQVAPTMPPNRVRSSFGANATNAAFGTLSIQRRFKNTLGVPVTRLRFRVVDITTFNNRVPGNTDLRVLSSTGQVTTSSGTVVATVNGLTLEQPAQPNGGGLNSTLTVALPSGGLAPGNTIDVQFLLGVQEQGDFRFLINVEALPGTGTISNDATRATKSGATDKQRNIEAGGAAKSRT
jgi:hypothetical protein